MADERPHEAVSIDGLVCDPRLQSRAGEVHREVIDEYAEHYSPDSKLPKLPPIETFEIDGRHYVVDGFHRVLAAMKARETFVRCTVVGEGSIEDAVWYAAGVNQAHGIRRTRKDERRAVQLALEHGEGESSRVIAKHVGVSHDFVNRMRRERGANQLSSKDSRQPNPAEPHEHENENKPERVQGIDGRWRKVRRPKPLGKSPTESATEAEPKAPIAEDDPFQEVARLIRRCRQGVKQLVDHQTIDMSLQDALRLADGLIVVACEHCDGGGCEHCDRGRLTKRQARAVKDKLRSQAIAHEDKTS